MKKTFVNITKIITCICLLNACKKPAENNLPRVNTSSSDNVIQCNQQTEQTDYSIYRMCGDGTTVGDVAPYYDSSASNFKIYFLKNLWSNTGQKHPLFAFTSSDFHNYTETSSIIASSSSTCAQDNSIGAASIIKNGSTYYAFYTGHNPDITSCINGVKREGVMLATSTNPTSSFIKNTSFTTILTPTGLGYDENDNWRDPFVIRDVANNNWMMLIAARKNVSGTWRGVIVKYTSTDLMNWTHQGVFYDGGTTNFFNMECPSITKIGSTYYLFFSDQSISTDLHKYVLYRKSSSLNGPWSLPTGSDRFDGNAFYAGRAVTDMYGDTYAFGWCHTLVNNVDSGAWNWGGNLITHKIYQLSNGDLAAAIPHTVKNWLETTTETLTHDSQWGNVTNTNPGTESYRLISNADFDVANVLYNPVNRAQYLITTNVSYASSSKDFGFFIGACDGYENAYQLRFVPSENKLKFEKKKRSQLNSTPDNDIALTLSPNTNYKVQIIIENSVVVVYINDQVAFTNRIYKATNTTWGIFTDHSDVTFSNLVVTHP